MALPPENGTLVFEDDGGCFGCSGENPIGLHLTFERRGSAIVSEYTVAGGYHGAPGIAHGGIIATILDEVSCFAAHFTRGTTVVTGEISVRYERPCPVEVPLVISAEVVEERRHYFVIEGRVTRDGELLAKSTGKFFPNPEQTTP